MFEWTVVVCKSGYHGKNCSYQCSINCEMIRDEMIKCDRFTGECDSGCKPGWTGTTCDQCKDVWFF